MDPNGIHGRKLAALLLVSALVLTGILLVAPPGTTDAATSGEPDTPGDYIWCDSKDPQPKVTYEWIDAKANGEEITEIDSSSGYTDRTLPFLFEYFGMEYDTISISARGYIQVGDDGGSSTYYSSNLPYSGDGVNGIIAVSWGSPYDYYTPTGVYGGIHYYVPLQQDFVCIEWNTNSGQITSEIIIYDTGLIKMQWKDLGSMTDYTSGTYLVAGIESPDGSVGRTYSKYSESNLMNAMAVEFSTNISSIEGMVLQNGHGDGHICFAEYDYYEFQFTVSAPLGYGDINRARIYFGDPASNLGGEIRISGGATAVEQFPNSDDFLLIDDEGKISRCPAPNPSENVQKLFNSF